MPCAHFLAEIQMLRKRPAHGNLTVANAYLKVWGVNTCPTITTLLLTLPATTKCKDQKKKPWIERSNHVTEVHNCNDIAKK